MMKLYDYAPSQNGYKIRMLLRLLGIEHEIVPVAILVRAWIERVKGRCGGVPEVHPYDADAFGAV